MKYHFSESHRYPRTSSFAAALLNLTSASRRSPAAASSVISPRVNTPSIALAASLTAAEGAVF